MTLTEARKVLEEYLTWMQSDVDEPEPYKPINEAVYEAMKQAISVLPKASTRPTAEERLEAILRNISLAKDGYNPFSKRFRGRDDVCWRECVWQTLAREGYRSSEIARATGYDHATIWHGIRRLRDYLTSGDPITVAVWEEYNSIKAASLALSK